MLFPPDNIQRPLIFQLVIKNFEGSTQKSTFSKTLNLRPFWTQPPLPKRITQSFY